MKGYSEPARNKETTTLQPILPELRYGERCWSSLTGWYAVLTGQYLVVTNVAKKRRMPSSR